MWANPAPIRKTRWVSLVQPPLNINAFIHGPAEGWPWRGPSCRPTSHGCCRPFWLGDLICIYGAGVSSGPATRAARSWRRPWWPSCQFAFIHGAVSNDAAITFFSAAAIWQLLRITNDELRMTNEEAGPSSTGSLALLGMTIGLAMLSKTAGLLLLVFCGRVAGVGVATGRAAARIGRGGAGGVAGALCWAAGGCGATGTLRRPTAANQFILLAGANGPTLRQVWHDMDRVDLLFARFGWMNVQPPVWVWFAWSGIAALAAIGALLE